MTIRWGILGCGNVTEKKSGQAYNKVPNSKLVAVMRRDALKAADYAKRHHVERWYANADELLNDKDINAISVATPPASHLTYVVSALEKGLPVYVEKPVALNAGEARQMAEAVKKYDGKLTVAHYRRALPMFNHIKNLLADNAIGSVRSVQLRMWKCIRPFDQAQENWRVNPEFSGGGYFHDLAPHQLDLMLYFFGEPQKYHGYALNQAGVYPADDHVCGEIVFKNNVVFNGSWCFNVAESQVVDQCEIIGSEGKISFPVFGKTVSWENKTEAQTIEFDHPEHIQQPMIEKIVSYFSNTGPNPCSVQDAIVLMELMDAFTKSE